MPTITLETTILTKEQKIELVKEFTASAASIINVPEQIITVYIKENDVVNVGFGGKLLSEQ